MTDIRETPTAPAFGEIVVPTSGNPDDLPKPVAPYYALYRQGAFIARPLVFGYGFVPFPKGLGSIRKLHDFENPKGTFYFDGPRLSAKVVNQAISFFRRIYAKQQTEAEVIVTQNQETGEHRLFVPFQSVSHGGVRSIYNPVHIAPNHLVIGTIHSHCNFGAYHSSTDEADAREMDGIHLTIGMLQNDPPQIAAMVALNKMFFHYEPDVLADITATEDTAPAWWDRYVLDRPATDADRPTWASDEDWNKFMGRVKKYTVTTNTGYQPAKPNPNGNYTEQALAWCKKNSVGDMKSEDWNAFRVAGAYKPATPAQTTTTPSAPAPSKTSSQLPKTLSRDDLVKLQDSGWIWDPETQNFVHISELSDYRTPTSEDLLPGGPRVNDDDDDDDQIDAWVAGLMSDYWEDELGQDFLDQLFNSGLMTDEDTDEALADFPASTQPEYWEAKFKRKLGRAVTFLRDQGYQVTVKITPPPRPLPGQQEAFPQIEAGAAPANEKVQVH